MRKYSREVAEVIIKSIECRKDDFLFDDDGVRPVKVAETNAEFDSLNWTPNCELDAEDSPDPLVAPALPFPFTG